MTKPKSIPSIQVKLDRQLIAYATAASAACAGILASPRAVEAKVVYTPANVAVLPEGILPIDLNNDGIPDFVVRLDRCTYQNNCLVVNPWTEGNGIRGLNGRASAGVYGLAVGPQQRFLTQFRKFSWSGSYVGFMVDAGAYGSGSWSGGPWANTTNRYLGLKFLIDGQIHYGWARMSVRVMRDKIRLTGYAYETIPNQQIFEGVTQDLPSATNLPPTDFLTSTPQPATLGLLARGTDGLAIWRRDDEVLPPEIAPCA